jgi:hypothetical protein
MTAQELKSFTLKDLGQLAKQRGVAGWHAMKKTDLIKVLSKVLGRKPSARQIAIRKASSPKQLASLSRAKASNGSMRSHGRNGNGRHGHGNGRHGHTRSVSVVHAHSKQTAKRQHIAERIRQLQHTQDRRKNLATHKGGGRARDRLVVMVRDPFWLHAYWEVSRQGVERAQAAMGQDWHGARPVLRLMEVCGGEGTSSVERVQRDISIHGGVNNWYVDVKDPPKSYRLDIGYLAPSGRFFALARSNVVTTPRAGTSDALDNNWSDVAENFEKIYAMNGGSSELGASAELEELFEERLAGR